MKKKLLSLLLCFACAASVFAFCGAAAPAPCLAETEAASEPVSAPRRLCVTGTGKVFASPDAATLNFGIRSRAHDLAAAENENAEIAGKVRETLKKLGFSEDSLISEQMSAYGTHHKNECECYEVNRNFQLQTEADADFDKIIAALTEAGANGFYGVRYQLTECEEATQEALRLAREDAIKKASALYENPELIEISECNSYWYYAVERARNGKSILVEASVQAVFLV